MQRGGSESFFFWLSEQLAVKLAKNLFLASGHHNHCHCLSIVCTGIGLLLFRHLQTPTTCRPEGHASFLDISMSTDLETTKNHKELHFDQFGCVEGNTAKEEWMRIRHHCKLSWEPWTETLVNHFVSKSSKQILICCVIILLSYQHWSSPKQLLVVWSFSRLNTTTHRGQ